MIGNKELNSSAAQHLLKAYTYDTEYIKCFHFYENFSARKDKRMLEIFLVDLYLASKSIKNNFDSAFNHYYSLSVKGAKTEGSIYLSCNEARFSGCTSTLQDLLCSPRPCIPPHPK
ncbi:jg11546 [Pararge aegeria aegeria]|uniref:Jg11546 protein n=1 Tax=Pararge aegeria aegeria TaxID=348720 RepID=A0A8S4RPH7_9NEOP|nr:jg11546 [Pararge aegeria aegeria]